MYTVSKEYYEEIPLESQSDTYDAIVVGGGPAGSTAAYLLQNMGHSTVLIDKCSFPRPKLCGGLITQKTINIIERVFNATPSTLQKDGIIDYVSDHYEIYNKNKPQLQKNADIPFYFVKRNNYDEYFLRRAEGAGVTVLEGEGVVDFIPRIQKVRTESGRILHARFVIGADGVHSRIRSFFPNYCFNQQEWKKNLASAIEISIDRDRIRQFSDVDHPILFFRNIRWGYAWLFPNSDRLLLGIAGLNQKNRGEFSTIFRNFTASIGLDDIETPLQGWALPYGNFVRRPVFARTLLTGDAGGFADPYLGEGIFYAHRTGELAAWAIHRSISNDSDAEELYLKALGKSVFPEMEYAKFIRSFFFSINEKIPIFPQKYILKYLNQHIIDLVHGKRSFKWLRKAGDLHERV